MQASSKNGSADGLFNLPLMYWIPKMHKSVPKARFIAGSSNVLTTRLAQVINTLLGAIKKELKGRDKEHIARTGIKRCWFIDSYEEVINCVKLLDRPSRGGQCINTYDFSTMYTTLDLGDLVSSLGHGIREAFQGHQYMLIVGTTAASLSCVWEDTDSRELASKAGSQS